MKKIIFLLSLFILFSSNTYAENNITKIDGILGYKIGQEIDFSKYKSTSDDIIINGQKIENDNKGGDIYYFTPKSNEMNITFDEYNIMSDISNKFVYGIMANKKYNNNTLCQNDMNNINRILALKFGKSDLELPNLIHFTDSKNSFKVAGINCQNGVLFLTMTDASLNM